MQRKHRTLVVCWSRAPHARLAGVSIFTVQCKRFIGAVMWPFLPCPQHYAATNPHADAAVAAVLALTNAGGDVHARARLGGTPPVSKWLVVHILLHAQVLVNANFTAAPCLWLGHDKQILPSNAGLWVLPPCLTCNNQHLVSGTVLFSVQTFLHSLLCPCSTGLACKRMPRQRSQ